MDSTASAPSPTITVAFQPLAAPSELFKTLYLVPEADASRFVLMIKENVEPSPKPSTTRASGETGFSRDPVPSSPVTYFSNHHYLFH